MDRSNIEKIAHTPEDRMLLAKVWDKINAGMRREIPASTCFLSPRELEMTKLQVLIQMGNEASVGLAHRLGFEKKEELEVEGKLHIRMLWKA